MKPSSPLGCRSIPSTSAGLRFKQKYIEIKGQSPKALFTLTRFFPSTALTKVTEVLANWHEPVVTPVVHYAVMLSPRYRILYLNNGRQLIIIVTSPIHQLVYV